MPSRCSAPSGNRSSGEVREATITPQTFPSTMIGAPIEAWMPSSAQRSFAKSVLRSSTESIRAGVPELTMRAVIVSPPKAKTRPV